MAADALSDVLKTIRLTGAIFFDVVAASPWIAESPQLDKLLTEILPGAQHLIAYHVMVKGRCFAGIVGEEPVAIDTGDVIVFTNCDPHVLSSSPGMRASPMAPDAFDAATGDQLPFYLSYGGDGPASAHFICGYLACDVHPFNPLLDNLPAVIRVASRQENKENWLGRFIHLAMTELEERRAGGESVLAKLSELMFIEVVRRHLEALPPAQVGWLAGLRDPFVGKALSLMHARPASNWTIEELAKSAGLSRSVLAERFAELVGMPPMNYLTRWRMQLASALLSKGNTNVAAVAAQVGYRSESAFSRAFKNTIGVPPSLWRRRDLSGSRLVEAALHAEETAPDIGSEQRTPNPDRE